MSRGLLLAIVATCLMQTSCQKKRQDAMILPEEDVRVDISAIGKEKLSDYGFLTSIFLMGYGIFRFGIEFFREADLQLGYFMGGMITMGQILCFLMILVGVLLMIFRKKISKAS